MDKEERHNIITSDRQDNAKCNKCYEYATIKKSCSPLKMGENAWLRNVGPLPTYKTAVLWLRTTTTLQATLRIKIE